MRDILDFLIARLGGNRLPGLLRELADAIEEEEDPEVLRRLGTSLQQMGNVALNRMRSLTDKNTPGY